MRNAVENEYRKTVNDSIFYGNIRIDLESIKIEAVTCQMDKNVSPD
jgi:hypothetical protein